MGQNQAILRHQKSTFPRAQRRARAKRAIQSKQRSERCERTSEQTSEWPSTYVSILVCSRPQWDGMALKEEQDMIPFSHPIMVQNNQEKTGELGNLLVRLLVHSQRSHICSALLALITRWAPHICLFAGSLTHFHAHEKDNIRRF